MRKIFAALLCTLMLCTSAFTQNFLFNMTPLDKPAIVKLSDEQLIENYIDVLVEVEALRTFYAKGGLVPKEYAQFKAIVKYKILLVQEINKRKLEVPRSE